MILGFVWVVPCQIIRWKDGDTAEVKIDRGWRDSREREGVRLLGLWCPEMNEPGGPEAKAYAEGLLPSGSLAVLHSKALARAAWGSGQTSLERTLGDLRLLNGSDFATMMIAAGHGTAKEAPA